MLKRELSKEEADCFLDLVDVLDSSDVRFVVPKKLAEGIGKAMDKFISDESLCERCTNLILFSMDETESKNYTKPIENKDSSFNYL